MGRKFVFIGIALAILISSCLSGCLDSEDEGIPVETKYDLTMKNELVRTSNAFAFDLLGPLDDGENLFYSPYSITIAMGMAYEGARGDTASEMEQVIHLPADSGTRHQLFSDLQGRINDPSSEFQLSTANAYWAQTGYPILQLYKDVLVQYYLAHGEDLDLSGDPVGSAARINKWVEEETNGRIKDLISPDLLSAARLVLTNAIYFKGTWLYEFDGEATENEPFLTANGSEIECDMMKMCDEDIDLYYAEKDGLKMLELPYKGRELSMFVILPSLKTADASALHIDEDTFASLHDSMRTAWVDIWIPRFEFEKRYSLVRTLSDLGMPTAFGMDADFSGMDGTRNLYISEVIHQTFVKVDEEGTEAAAATAVIMSEKGGIGGSDPIPETFHADHPFLFLIQHKATGQILFMGKVEDPTV